MGNGILGMSQGLLGSKALLAGGGEQVDFFIHGYTDTKFTVFGWDIYLTTTHISMIIVIAPFLFLQSLQTRAIKKADPNKVPGPFLNVVELIVESLDGMLPVQWDRRKH